MEWKTIDGKSPLAYAKLACDTLMRKFAPDALPPVRHFHYHQGVFLSGMHQTYVLCREERYYAYIKAWVDSLVDPYGDITSFNPGQLDDLQPGVLLFPLYERTHDPRYKRALDTIAYYLSTFPRNPEGGYWHKAWYRNQMWLDGLYMAGPFCAQYGQAFDAPSFFDRLVEQAKLMEEKTRDIKTGLWYHAWDYEKQQPWADPDTGLSPEFWGRSIGWVPVALLNDLDYLPEAHPARPELSRMARELLLALLPYQDEATGLWYQVVNKGGEPGNWVESSCTCLYTAALCKAVRLGLLDDACLCAAGRGYHGVIRRLGSDQGGVLIDNICIGTGVGKYDHYCARPTSTNDLHGIGAFLIMCTEMERMASFPKKSARLGAE